ncbi:MAG: hypothetical protein IGR90_06235 [Synechococcales cyanobacterium K32_A2020_035]|nr:hypothetical protein [Synechococcales cyanobacterium K32_A2020_035]
MIYSGQGMDIEQLVTCEVTTRKLMQAIADRDEELLLELIPDNEDDHVRDYTVMLCGILSELMKAPGREVDFRWVMGTTCLHPGHEEFTCLFWISMMQIDCGNAEKPNHD